MCGFFMVLIFLNVIGFSTFGFNFTFLGAFKVFKFACVYALLHNNQYN